jgi:hypothetical protein
MKPDVDSEAAFFERSLTVDPMKLRAGKGLRE